MEGDEPIGWASDDGDQGGYRIDAAGAGASGGVAGWRAEAGSSRAGGIWPEGGGGGAAGSLLASHGQSPLHAMGGGPAHGVGVSTSVAEGTSLWSGSQYHRKGGRGLFAREGEGGEGEHSGGAGGLGQGGVGTLYGGKSR